MKQQVRLRREGEAGKGLTGWGANSMGPTSPQDQMSLSPHIRFISPASP